MGVKVYFIESTDIYGSIGFCGGIGFFSEADADQFERGEKAKNHVGMSYMVNKLGVKYSHRNGEIESPEVDGWYFVEWNGQWEVRQNPCQDTDTTVAREKYYGPIPMPEEF